MFKLELTLTLYHREYVDEFGCPFLCHAELRKFFELPLKDKMWIVCSKRPTKHSYKVEATETKTAVKITLSDGTVESKEVYWDFRDWVWWSNRDGYKYFGIEYED